MEVLFGTSGSVIILIIFFIVVCFFAAVKILFKRERKMNKDHTLINGMRIGNAQLIGEHAFQNDYFTIMPTPDSLLAIVADGATKRRLGKYASVIAIDILKSNFLNGLHAKGKKEYFTTCYEAIKKRLNDNIYGNKVATTILALIIEDATVTWSSVGNCALFLYRNSEMIRINDIEKNEPEFGRLSIHDKDLLFMCTDGAYSSLTELEIIHELTKKIHPYDKTMNLSRKIQQKRYNYQDNATMIVIEDMN